MHLCQFENVRASICVRLLHFRKGERRSGECRPFTERGAIKRRFHEDESVKDGRPCPNRRTSLVRAKVRERRRTMRENKNALDVRKERGNGFWVRAFSGKVPSPKIYQSKLSSASTAREPNLSIRGHWHSRNRHDAFRHLAGQHVEGGAVRSGSTVSSEILTAFHHK